MNIKSWIAFIVFLGIISACVQSYTTSNFGNANFKGAVNASNTSSTFSSESIKDPPSAPAVGYCISHFNDNFSSVTVDYFPFNGANFLESIDMMGFTLSNGTIQATNLSDGTMQCIDGDCTGVDDMNSTSVNTDSIGSLSGAGITWADSQDADGKNLTSLGYTEVGNGGNNRDLLLFDTSRNWKFLTTGTGGNTDLQLQSLTDSKYFRIKSQSGYDMLNVKAKDTGGELNINVSTTIYDTNLDLRSTSTTYPQINLRSGRGEDANGGVNRSAISLWSHEDDAVFNSDYSFRGLSIEVHADSATQPHHVTFYSALTDEGSGYGGKAIQWQWGNDSNGRFMLMDLNRIEFPENYKGWNNETQYNAIESKNETLYIIVDSDDDSTINELIVFSRDDYTSTGKFIMNFTGGKDALYGNLPLFVSTRVASVGQSAMEFYTNTNTLGMQMKGDGKMYFPAGADMLNKPIQNIGAAGTDFTATGGLNLADDMNSTSVNTDSIGSLSGSGISWLDSQDGNNNDLYDIRTLNATNMSLVGKNGIIEMRDWMDYGKDINFKPNTSEGYGRIQFYPEGNSLPDIILQVHNSSWIDGSSHQHIQLYTTNSTGDTITRFAIPYKVDIANWEIKDSNVMILGQYRFLRFDDEEASPHKYNIGILTNGKGIIIRAVDAVSDAELGFGTQNSSGYDIFYVDNNGDVTITGDIDVNSNSIAEVGSLSFDNDYPYIQTDAGANAKFQLTSKKNTPGDGFTFITYNTSSSQIQRLGITAWADTADIDITYANLDLNGNTIKNAGNVTSSFVFSNAGAQVNHTMISSDGTVGCCGMGNDLSYSCVAGAC